MNHTPYIFSPIRKNAELPTKVRTTKESPLAMQIKKLQKPGHSFVIENGQLSSLAPTVYATAKRLGVKVTLRTENNGLAVFLKEHGQMQKAA